MSFDPDWTFEEMLAADLEAIEQNPKLRGVDRPFNQWMHHLCCQELKRRYENGYRYALLQAVKISGTFEIPIPRWASRSFSLALHSYEYLEVTTLDEAFGVSRKGLHIESQKKRHKLRAAIFLRISEIRRQDNSQVIDEDLFQRAGEEFNVSGSTARDLYYEMEKWNKEFRSSGLPSGLVGEIPLTGPKK